MTDVKALRAEDRALRDEARSLADYGLALLATSAYGAMMRVQDRLEEIAARRDEIASEMRAQAWWRRALRRLS